MGVKYWHLEFAVLFRGFHTCRPYTKNPCVQFDLKNALEIYSTFSNVAGQKEEIGDTLKACRQNAGYPHGLQGGLAGLIEMGMR